MRERRKSTGTVWAWITAIIGLPVLYVLGLGAAVWMNAQGYLSPPVKAATEVFYLPLFLIAQCVPAGDSILEWYISCFE